MKSYYFLRFFNCGNLIPGSLIAPGKVLVIVPFYQLISFDYDRCHSSIQFNPLSANDKRLSRVKGGHKGAFTKLEKKMADILTTVIVTEGLLKTLQDKMQVIHRYDAEMELLLDDDDQLCQDMELSTQFYHNATVTVAHLSALINNYRRASKAR